jgi:signal transduction histidine kinase
MTQSPTTISPNGKSAIKRRTREVYQEIMSGLFRDKDKLFAYLFIAQWAFALLLALFYAPYRWPGKVQSTHFDVYAALIFGALLCLPPLLLFRGWPGTVLTRQTNTVVQMLWSVLLIYLSVGRLEAHFHLFCSLAFLAFYRDYYVLLTATLFAIVDPLLRVMMWPEPVYGVTHLQWWRILEHAFGVAFEAIILVISIREARRLILDVSTQRAEGEWLTASLEKKVVGRTEALYNSNQKLQGSLKELRLTQRQLIDASRKAGMADVATNVLHNVGNILNSVNVSASLVFDAVRTSKASGLPKALTMLHAQPDPGRFLCEDPKGAKLLDYFGVVSKAIEAEQKKLMEELTSLIKNIEHIKIIVGMQQSYARQGGMREWISLHAIINDAVHTNSASYEKHDIETTKELSELDEIECDRHKLFQILINLLSNAKQAVKDQEGEKKIVVRASKVNSELEIEVEDNGVGIAPQNLEKIFSHGFTTKKQGHGFGLHSCANAATEMGGCLTVRSQGLGRGACFTLRLPLSSSAELLSAR